MSLSWVSPLAGFEVIPEAGEHPDACAESRQQVL
jgi:hypothetical protein